MGTKHQQGFTIIEVSLFLALSALMAVLLLGGWSSMINTQRYKDSNKTLQTFLQDQYNLVYNVENARAASLGCRGGTVSDDGNQPRGQTDCVLLGRYITLEEGKQMRVNAIVGSEPSSDTPPENNDIATFEQFEPVRLTNDIGLSNDSLTIPWDATAVNPVNDDARTAAIIIIRSPESGIVYTFTQNYEAAPPSVEEMVQTTPSDFVLCIEAGAPLTGSRMGVVLTENASSQSGVQTIFEDDDRC